MDRPLYLPRGPRRFHKTGGPEEWGTPVPLLHRSITDLREQELVTHVLNDTRYRETLFNIKGMRTKGARILEEVPLRLLREDLAGDIDVLVIPQGQPEVSTAIQVKRFEAVVRMNEEGGDVVEGGSPERYRKLMAKGIKQANRTKALGFAQVYLWIFIVIDTRHRNNGWHTYDGADSLLTSRLQQSISPIGLDPAIGLMKFEWCQPMDRSPFDLSTHGGHLWRSADMAPQPSTLTERLRSLPSPVIQPLPHQFS